LEYSNGALEISVIDDWSVLIEHTVSSERAGNLNGALHSLEILLSLEEEQIPFTREWLASQMERIRSNLTAQELR